jgi:hypothetical protein
MPNIMLGRTYWRQAAKGPTIWRDDGRPTAALSLRSHLRETAESVPEEGANRAKSVKEIGLSAIYGERKQMSRFDVSR